MARYAGKDWSRWVDFPVTSAMALVRAAPECIRAMAPSFRLPSGTPDLAQDPEKYASDATISAAFSGAAPAFIAAWTAFLITTSSGSSPTDASTTVIRLIRLISGPAIGQKISSAMEFAAAKTGMTSAPCPLVAASILSLVIESGSKVEAIVAAKTTLSFS